VTAVGKRFGWSHSLLCSLSSFGTKSVSDDQRFHDYRGILVALIETFLVRFRWRAVVSVTGFVGIADARIREHSRGGVPEF
jgi:hypothetical protein